MANPEFTETFRINSDWKKYTTSIQHLRARVGDPSAQPCRGHGLLPAEDPNTSRSRKRWFAVVLQTDDSSITLRIRRENLYLDAYQMGNNTWVEYYSKYGRLYQNSVLLQNCDGSYPQLEIGTPGRGNIPLTLENFKLAVDMLAEIDGWTSDARMYQIVVIQMICEALRFHCIPEYLASEHATTGAPAWMIGREGSWARLSRILIANADAYKPFNESQEFITETQIWSNQDVFNALAMVKPEPKPAPKSQ